MILPRFNNRPKLIKFLSGLDCFKNDPFFFIDVGCSGGIARDIIDIWHPAFRGLGFDPIIDEIERLRKINTYPDITYVDAFVGCGDAAAKMYDEPDCPSQTDPNMTTDFLGRSSAFDAIGISATNYGETYLNKGEKISHTTRTVSLDEYLTLDDKNAVNFIKTDTDGFDHLVLMGAEEVLRSPNLLGLFVEVSLHGKVWKAANNFTVVDRFVRKFGFSLHDMEVYRYARAALPSPFYYDIPAQTVSGQINWGDVLYFRDYSSPDYERNWFAPPSTTAIFKLACLFECCGLPDCAAELLIKYKNEVEEVVELKTLLNLLAPGERTYDEHMALFEKHMKAKEWKKFA